MIFFVSRRGAAARRRNVLVHAKVQCIDSRRGADILIYQIPVRHLDGFYLDYKSKTLKFGITNSEQHKTLTTGDKLTSASLRLCVK